MKRFIKAARKRLRFLWTGTEELEATLDKTRRALWSTQNQLEGAISAMNRQRAGLINIHAHAIRGPIMPFAPEVLRDYCREVLDNPMAKSRQYGTEGVSVAQRWGYDFTKAPGDKTPPPRIRRN